VLAPFNSIQIDALLHKLPQWAKLSQECHALFDGLENVVNLCFRRESADAETNTAVGTLIAASQRSEDVARFQRGRCACATGRERDVFQSHEERLSLNIGERNIDTARVVALAIAIESCVLKRQEPFEKAVGQGGDPLGVIL
jgi:hypothetical protein